MYIFVEWILLSPWIICPVYNGPRARGIKKCFGLHSELCSLSCLHIGRKSLRWCLIKLRFSKSKLRHWAVRAHLRFQVHTVGHNLTLYRDGFISAAEVLPLEPRRISFVCKLWKYFFISSAMGNCVQAKINCCYLEMWKCRGKLATAKWFGVRACIT